MAPPSTSSNATAALRISSSVNIKGAIVDIAEEVEHLGVIRSVEGNGVNLFNRFSSHKKALGGVLHTGMARHHRGNPAASLRTEKIYGASVLFSGLGSLHLKKDEIDKLDSHYNTTLQNLMRLHPRTPRCVVSFLAGSLPGKALLHLRQFSLFGMILQKGGGHLHSLSENILTISKRNTNCWIQQLRDLCLVFRLPHPLTLLSEPPSKSYFSALVKKHVLNYWEIKLRLEADSTELTSLRYFHPEFQSLSRPHFIWTTAGSSPYQVAKAIIQAKMLSGRYRTERLSRFWSKNKEGFCLLPSCHGNMVHEDLEHILIYIVALYRSAEMASWTSLPSFPTTSPPLSPRLFRSSSTQYLHSSY